MPVFVAVFSRQCATTQAADVGFHDASFSQSPGAPLGIPRLPNTAPSCCLFIPTGLLLLSTPGCLKFSWPPKPAYTCHQTLHQLLFNTAFECVFCALRDPGRCLLSPLGSQKTLQPHLNLHHCTPTFAVNFYLLFINQLNMLHKWRRAIDILHFFTVLALSPLVLKGKLQPTSHNSKLTPNCHY